MSMHPVFTWWMVVEILGLAALPLTYWLFKNLPDRGYAFAKPLGILLTSYVLWIGGSFGFLRNSWGGIVFSILVVAVGSWWFYSRENRETGMASFLRENRRMVIANEVLFALAFALFALYRAYNPEIMGTEKPMEFAFLNAILRSDTFPPHDPWLSGFGISYYYFGYLMMAMLTKLSGVPSPGAFNLGITLLFALTVTGAYALVYNLVKGAEEQRSRGAEEQGKLGDSLTRYLLPLLGPIFVAILGNLETIFEVLYSKGLGSAGFWNWLDIKELVSNGRVTGRWFDLGSGWWWWRASRVIHDKDLLGNSMEVIDEFPFFSFMLGDMHPHVLALPFVLLALALALNVLRQRSRGAGGKSPTPIFHLPSSIFHLPISILQLPTSTPLRSLPGSIGLPQHLGLPHLPVRGGDGLRATPLWTLRETQLGFGERCRLHNRWVGAPWRPPLPALLHRLPITGRRYPAQPLQSHQVAPVPDLLRAVLVRRHQLSRVGDEAGEGRG
jgi:YYY domain-containing protein